MPIKNFGSRRGILNSGLDIDGFLTQIDSIGGTREGPTREERIKAIDEVRKLTNQNAVPDVPEPVKKVSAVDAIDIMDTTDPDPAATHFIKILKAQNALTQQSLQLKASEDKGSDDHVVKSMVNDIATDMLMSLISPA